MDGILPPKVCGYVKENGTKKMDDDEMEEGFHQKLEELKLLSADANSTQRSKRQAPEFLTILRQTRCPLLLVADYR